jgi:hypothetical protein
MYPPYLLNKFAQRPVLGPISALGTVLEQFKTRYMRDKTR